MTKKELKAYFLYLVKLLDEHEMFDNISLSGKTMVNEKKDSYWSTVVFRGARVKKFKLGYATIYINLRDLATPEKVREAVAHEAGHLIRTKSDILELLKSLDATKKETEKLEDTKKKTKKKEEK